MMVPMPTVDTVADIPPPVMDRVPVGCGVPAKPPDTPTEMPTRQLWSVPAPRNCGARRAGTVVVVGAGVLATVVVGAGVDPVVVAGVAAGSATDSEGAVVVVPVVVGAGVVGALALGAVVGELVDARWTMRTGAREPPLVAR